MEDEAQPMRELACGKGERIGYDRKRKVIPRVMNFVVPKINLG